MKRKQNKMSKSFRYRTSPNHARKSKQETRRSRLSQAINLINEQVTIRSSLQSNSSFESDSTLSQTVSITNPKSSYCFNKGGETFHKKYGVISSIKIIISATLVSGIFQAPRQLFPEIHNSGVTLIIWSCYGLVAFLGSLVYAELGATFPVSTGDYAYLVETFGSLAGFLYQWSQNLVVIPCVNAILACILAQNLVAPFININDDPSSQEQWAVMLLAIGVILFISYMACTSPQSWDDGRGFVFFLKIFLVGILLLCGVIYVSQFGAFTHTEFQLGKPSAKKYPKLRPIKHLSVPAEFVKSIFLASYSFMGLNSLNIIAEDIRKPSRTIPVAIYTSAPIILVTYLLLLFIYFAVLDQNAIGSSGMCGLISTKLVQQSLSIPSLNHYIQIIIPTLVASAIGGTLLYRVVTFSKLTFIGYRKGHVPKVYALLSISTNFPVVAVFFSAFLSCIYLVFITLLDLESFIMLTTNVELLFMALSTYALIYTKIQRSDIQRPFKMHVLFPIIFATITTVLVVSPSVILFMDNSFDSFELIRPYLGLLGGMTLIFQIGLPVFFIFIGQRRKCLQCFYVIHDHLLVLAQKFFVALPEGKLPNEKKNTEKIEVPKQ